MADALTSPQQPRGAEAAHPDLTPSGMESIETSVLEDFLEIKAEWVRWNTYLERAEELKPKIRPAVYQRVVDDYSSRRAEIGERLAPMLARVRGEYEKLDAVVARLTRAHED